LVANSANARKIRKHAELPTLVPDSPGDDRWMYSELLRERNDATLAAQASRVASQPSVPWNKRILCKRIGFGFNLLLVSDSFVKRIDIYVVARASQMQSDVTKFVQQCKPKIIQPIVTKRQRQHRPRSRHVKRSSINRHSREAAFDHNSDPKISHRAQGQTRPILTDT
jgi:hypothetical protein